jgi:transketolase
MSARRPVLFLVESTIPGSTTIASRPISDATSSAVDGATISLGRFGASAPRDTLMRAFGFPIDRAARAAAALIG